jgi:ATP-dependent DNA helicase RecG
MTDLQGSFDFTFPEPSLPQLWSPDDIYAAADADIVRRFGEDHRVERKRATVSKRDLADYLSMWANTQPNGGVVFIGVADDGSIFGCKGTAENHLSDLRSVREYCPDARIEFRDIPVLNASGHNDYILALRVHYREDRLVETAFGDAFIREGRDKRRLLEAEKREIRLQKGELDVESERVTLAFPEQFDPVVLEDFRRQYVAKRRLANRYSLPEILALAKLGKMRDGAFEPNLACALLFAKDARQVAPGAFIRVIRYDGIEERFGQSQNIVSAEVIDGPLPLQIAEAERYISQQIRSFIRMGVDGRFANNPEYPKSAWLEAIVNAVCHRSYNLKNMNIFVKMFEDKIVIESPGAFMPPTTPTTVYESHNPRNPNLMWALYYFDYVQCAYEGTRRMRDVMRQANLPDPIFDQKEVGNIKIIVTLKNNVEHRKFYVRSEAAYAINPEIFESLSESEKMVVNYLADKQRINVRDTGLLIGKDWRGADAVLKSLQSKKIIERSAGKYRSRHRFYYLKNAVKIT